MAVIGQAGGQALSIYDRKHIVMHGSNIFQCTMPEMQPHHEA